LGALPEFLSQKMESSISKAIRFCDENIDIEYRKIDHSHLYNGTYRLHPGQFQYLYMRSFFPKNILLHQNAYDYFLKQGTENVKEYSNYERTELNIVLLRTNRFQLDTAANTEVNYGTLSKSVLLIELMEEANRKNLNGISISSEQNRILNVKKPNGWVSNIQTADACFALLLNAEDDHLNIGSFNFELGNPPKNSAQQNNSSYHYQLIEGKEISPESATLKVTKNNTIQEAASCDSSYGNLYWQYFDESQQNQLLPAVLQLNKTYWKMDHTVKNNSAVQVFDGDELKKGDTIRIRLEVHMGETFRHLQIDEQRAASMKVLKENHILNTVNNNYKKFATISGNRIFIEKNESNKAIFEEKVILNQIGIFHTGITVAQDMNFPEVRVMIDGIQIRVIEK
jgi:predicted small secreted protein